MGASTRLRLTEVRSAFRLVGECRDLGRDPSAWRVHAGEGLSRLIGSVAVNVGELRWPDRSGPIVMAHALEVGYTGRMIDFYTEFMRDHGPNDPIIHRAFEALTGRLDTQTRSRLIDDRTWRRAPFYALMEAVDIEHSMFSLHQIDGPGSINGFVLHRPAADRDFSARDRALVNLFHEELGLLLGSTLATSSDARRTKLPPRVRQTLDCLLEGDSEKLVATRLGLSRATVHQYVIDLYRRFGVSSRGELLAEFVNRPASKAGRPLAR